MLNKIKLSIRTLCMFFKCVLLLVTMVSLGACDSQIEESDNKPMATNTLEIETPFVQKERVPVEPEIENKSYLFDITDHSIEELQALLVRAEEVSQTHPDDFEDLEIVMIIHGPDIDLFTSQNYAENKKLIDLASRLDAYDVIDMKVCEKTMSLRGVDRQDIPPFIESVPYAPSEIKQRLQNGYINL